MPLHLLHNFHVNFRNLRYTHFCITQWSNDLCSCKSSTVRWQSPNGNDNEVYDAQRSWLANIHICLPMVALLNQTKYSIIPMVIKHLWCATVLIIKQYIKGVAQDSSSSIFAILTFLRILQSVFICFLLQNIIFQLTTLSYLEKC